MAGYKDPSFEERTARAQEARAKALKLLADRPPVDEAVVAQRKAAQLARDADVAAKSAARKAAISQAKADKLAASMVPVKAKPTEAELKAARDERYAARRKRNS